VVDVVRGFAPVDAARQLRVRERLREAHGDEEDIRERQQRGEPERVAASNQRDTSGSDSLPPRYGP